jgi:hypothetical protein
MKITRRKLAAALVTSAAIPAPAQQPAEDLMKTKRDLMQANAKAVADLKIPMATEPAFQFKP